MPQIGYSTIADHFFFYPEQRIVFNQESNTMFFSEAFLFNLAGFQTLGGAFVSLLIPSGLKQV